MVGHIKGLLAKLELNLASYSEHSLHIEGATTAITFWTQGLVDQVPGALEEQHILDIYKGDEGYEGCLCREDGPCPSVHCLQV